MGSFLTNATGTGNSFAAQGPNSLMNQNTMGLAGNISQSQSGFNNAFSGQQSLAGQLQAQANGQGPNPAQMQMQQGTNRAIQQNAGMIASQKGINPALAARLASQNAASMGQQAAGQGAMMGAKQQLNAQGQLGSVYGQMGNQQAGMQSTLQNALASFNNNQVGMQSNLNNVGAGVAAQNAATAGGLAGGLFNAAGPAVSQAGSAISGIISGFSRGGEVPKKMADGGPVLSNWGYGGSPDINSGASSYAGKYLNSGADAMNKGLSSWAGSGSTTSPTETVGTDPGWDMGGGLAGGAGDVMGAAAPASAGAGLAGDASLALLASKGAVVPGKAKVAGNSLKNDKVPAMLSPKEIVLPRTVTMHPDAPRKAAEFVAAVQARHGRKMPMRKAS